MNKIRVLLILLFCLVPACTITNTAAQLPQPTGQPTQQTPTDQPAQLATPETITCTVTAAEALNLRESFGTSGKIIVTLKHGEVVTILPHPAQGNWIAVRTESGREGWINQIYCEPEGK